MRSATTAFTLIEVLAVLVLLGMTATLAVGGLTRSTETARLQEARSALSTLDARARIFARTGGSVRIERDRETGRFRVVRPATAEILAITELPLGAEATLRQGSLIISALPVDARGASPDYQIVLSAGAVTESLDVEGVTGLVHEDPAP